MTTQSSKALAIARAYVQAIAERNVDAIMAISAPDVVCTSPIGQTTGIERFRAFQEGFARMITNLTVLAVHGDDSQAVVVYDVETHPVPHAVTAELLVVKGGKIVSTNVIYDATPFAAYMTGIQPH